MLKCKASLCVFMLGVASSLLLTWLRTAAGQTGQQFTGHSSQYSMLAQMIQSKTGIPVPASVIEKL